MKRATWVAIPGWPYEVSDSGLVRSLGGRRGAIAGRILKPQPSIGRNPSDPYDQVTLRDYPRSRIAKVHTLVLECFVGPRPTEKHEGNHKNGIKRDNRLANLEWVTRSENMLHAFRTGLRSGEPRNVKIPPSLVPSIRARAAGGESNKSLAAEFGVDRSSIENIVKKRTWAHIP